MNTSMARWKVSDSGMSAVVRATTPAGSFIGRFREFHPQDWPDLVPSGGASIFIIGPDGFAQYQLVPWALLKIVGGRDAEEFNVEWNKQERFRR